MNNISSVFVLQFVCPLLVMTGRKTARPEAIKAAQSKVENKQKNKREIVKMQYKSRQQVKLVRLPRFDQPLPEKHPYSSFLLHPGQS